MIKFIIIGVMIGILYFYFFENSVSNSFLSSCWIRQQPKLLVHNKVYLIGSFLIYRGFVNNDRLIVLLGASWIGLHGTQDLAERAYENNKKMKKELTV